MKKNITFRKFQKVWIKFKNSKCPAIIFSKEDTSKNLNGVPLYNVFLLINGVILKRSIPANIIEPAADEDFVNDILDLDNEFTKFVKLGIDKIAEP